MTLHWSSTKPSPSSHIGSDWLWRARYYHTVSASISHATRNGWTRYHHALLQPAPAARRV
ncbi:hypothetical protein C8Q74DRAFT_1276151 [Fomes fomentarius]|nr:hypothetical protein C8Q74DRAFT_1276151 [Fomes fomentarius]